MLNKAEVLALCHAEHGDPFAALGLHADTKGRLWLRTMQPGADAVFVIDAETGQELIELEQRKLDGLLARRGALMAQAGPAIAACN